MGQPSSSTIPREDMPFDSSNQFKVLARTWLGGLALAWDEIHALAQAPAILVARGEAIEQNVMAHWHRFAGQTRAMPRRVKSALLLPLDWVAGGVHQSTACAEDELERQVVLALDRLGIPSRERLMQLGNEIDALTERIDAELARQTV